MKWNTYWVIMLCVVIFIGCKAESDQVSSDQVSSDQVSSDQVSNDEVSNEQVTKEQPLEVVNGVVKITVTSDSINSEGKLLTVTTGLSNSPTGENSTPQLTWDEVEEADSYAIYMVDGSANNWLHWKASGIKECSLEQGEEIEGSRYKGPYPPKGSSHTYKILVYALAAEADEYWGTFDASNKSMSSIEERLDQSGGKTGNIIGRGYIEGTYKRGEVNE